MNIITIAGTIGKDAEMRHLPDGTAVASFSVADSQGRDKPTIWWRCAIFGKRAESLQSYLRKGVKVTVAGTITEREWTDKDGQKKTAQDVRVNEIALQGDGQQAKAAPAAPKTSAASSGFDDMADDIPFRDPLAYRAAHLVL